MEKLNNPSEFSLIFKYALKDLSRNYHKISSIIVTLFISLFILSAIFTIEDSLKKELNDNAKALLGGDLEIDYNRNQGNLDLVNKVKEFATVSQMIEFSTMLSTTGREKNKSLFTRIKTVDEKYPLYGNVVYEPIGAYERMQKEPNTILINESLSKTLNIKINELVKVQDQNFKVIGIITNRDVRFSKNLQQPIRELMPKTNLITSEKGISIKKASDILKVYKIEKLIARVLEKINSRGSVTSVQDNSSLSSNS